MPNPVRRELIPEFIDTQLPERTRLRCCFDAPLMSGDAGQLLWRVMRRSAVTLRTSPRRSHRSAFAAMVENCIVGYAGKAPAGRVLDRDSTACLVYGQQECGMFSAHVGEIDRRRLPRRGERAVRRRVNQHALRQGHSRHPAPRDQKAAPASFSEVRMKLCKLAARVRVRKGRVEVPLAARCPGSE